MLLSATDEEVLAAAEAFGEELAESQPDGASAEFETMLKEYNDVISEATGLNYGSVCSTDDCC
ncbi:halo-CC-star protein HcsS [Halospeciosus flavus]|uniref:Halo-CC-star protein HcsS n=1 Tax=Halospeciosus flavus TaxID=3032283 RepID=A0ABD5YWM1_9EURY|nr:halo-CC-star protein HcsS [Halospeciosus flavus]